MKPFIFASMLALIAIFSTSFFVPKLDGGANFSLKIAGVENFDSKQGVPLLDLPHLVVESNDEKINVEQLKVVLVRDNKSVSLLSFDGNKFDLATFAKEAKSGDFFVIELTKIEGLELYELSVEETFYKIPIN